jgi:hypothetical protein
MRQTIGEKILDWYVLIAILNWIHINQKIKIRQEKKGT